MTRTQIQLPDAVWADLKRLADSKEWSIAEAVRRGVELLIHAYPPPDATPAAWTLPSAVDLGDCKVPVEQWRAVANERDA